MTDEDHKRFSEFFFNNIEQQDFDLESYEQFIKDAQEDLKAFEDPLLGFYADEAISNYDFPVLLMRAYSIRGFGDTDSYLTHIMKDDEARIKENLIAAILTIEASENKIDNNTARITAKTMLEDREALTRLIRSTPTTENYRWILMLLIDSPKEYLDVFRKLQQDIEPVFNKYLKQYQEKLEQFEDTVVRPLTDNPKESFTTLTRDIIPLDILEEENLLITSFVNQTRFSVLNFDDDRYILYGLEMMYGFKRLADFELNNRESRAKVFKALSDSTRNEVLRHLARGITSTKDIANSIGISSATVTYHINAFLQTKIIKSPKTKDMKFIVDFDRLESFWKDFINDLKN